MIWLVIILGIPLGLVLGFLAGVRYCGTRMLPTIMARMSPRELSRVANEASKLARFDEKDG